jgi:mono/diheme cytochrome c family protein
MRLLLLRLLVFGIVGSALIAVADSHVAAQGNAEAAKLQNPMEASPETIFYGKSSYAKHCARCHGANAQGGAGDDQVPPAPNLTDVEWKHGSSDGEIFTVIKDGVPPDFKMAAWGDQLTVGEMWRIVTFLRSLAKR